jgi:hypothetical protein
MSATAGLSKGPYKAHPLTPEKLHTLRTWAELAADREDRDARAETLEAREVLCLLANLDEVNGIAKDMVYEAREAAHAAGLRAEAAEKELAESRKLDEQMRDGLAWIDGIVDRSRCAFCVPESMQNGADLERAKEHMKTCDKHPLGAAEARIVQVEEAACRVLALEGRGTCAYPTADDAGKFYRALADLRDLVAPETR